MVVTHSGPAGLGVPIHVDQELSVAFVHAPIPHQQTVDETAVDWDKLQNCKDVTHTTVQVFITFLGFCLFAFFFTSTLMQTLQSDWLSDRTLPATIFRRIFFSDSNCLNWSRDAIVFVRGEALFKQ